MFLAVLLFLTLFKFSSLSPLGPYLSSEFNIQQTADTIPDALVYYLRHVVRDYSDPVVTTILRNISQAMTDPDSRVLISEQLNPDVSSMAGPLPLYAAFKDFSMLSIGGKERSLPQFAAVADAAGLRVSGVFRDEATAHAVVELALKEDTQEV